MSATEGIELIVPDSVVGPDAVEQSAPPVAYFVLYRERSGAEQAWHMISEILVAHDTDELIQRVFDRYPVVKQASRVKFIPADSGIAYETTWEKTE